MFEYEAVGLLRGKVTKLPAYSKKHQSGNFAGKSNGGAPGGRTPSKRVYYFAIFSTGAMERGASAGRSTLRPSAVRVKGTLP